MPSTALGVLALVGEKKVQMSIGRGENIQIFVLMFCFLVSFHFEFDYRHLKMLTFFCVDELLRKNVNINDVCSRSLILLL